MEHNNDINKHLCNLYNAVFALAAERGGKWCLDTEDINIHEVRAKTNNEVTLFPISGGEGTPNDTLLFNLNPSRLVYRDGLAQWFENIGKDTAFKGVETTSELQYVQGENEKGSVIKLNTDSITTEGIAPKTDGARNCIGVGKVDLPKFSTLYSGETAKWAAKVESLLDSIFAATNKQQTILKTIGDYNAAKKLAKNGQVYELKLLADRLQGRINKQGAMQTAKDTMNAQGIAKRKMIFSAVAVVVLVFLYLVFFGNREVASTQTGTDIQATTAQISELDKAIQEWEQATGKKIYPKGRECLAKSTKGMTKDQIIRVINQNIK
ncbi:MAG: hypothetical protein K6F33_00285 [Bacteroidales bacterium]|nr:hypothetical protein [Bacteroidales bacterium]